MKNFKTSVCLFLIQCFLLLPDYSYSQYVNFPLDSAIWRIDYYNSSGCSPGPQPNGSFQYTLDGDSVLNSITYSKIYSSGISNCLTFGYCGLLRDDTLSQKVYYVYPDSVNELLMYDFSVNVGDTINDIYNAFPLFYHVVDSVDQVTLGGVSRKRIRYISGSPVMEPYIIEGMGNASGLMAPLESPGELFDLTCFSYNGTSIYPTSSSDCSLIDNVFDANSEYATISIFPNPIHSIAMIEYSGREIQEVRIVDSCGRIMKRLFPVSGKCILEAEGMSDGFYIALFLSENEIAGMSKILLSK